MEAQKVGAPKGGGRLEAQWPFCLKLIEPDNDITLAELRDAFIDAFGVSCTTSGLYDLLKRYEYTYKKGSSHTNAISCT